MAPMDDMEFDELLAEVAPLEAVPAKADESLEEVVKTLDARFVELTILVNEAVKNRAEVVEITRLMDEAEATEKQLKYFRKVKTERAAQPSAAISETESISQPRVGLSLSRKDLPKFQLKTDVPRPFPQEEVFESAEHFLRTFEKILVSANMDIEKNWASLLPLCSHDDHDAWWQDEMSINARNWSDAKNIFVKKHGSRSNHGRFMEKVWTMNMSKNESINQYTTRFLKAVHDARFNPKSFYIASRFVSSLTPAVKRCFNLSWYGNHSEDERFTVQQVSSLTNNIMGADFSQYEAQAMCSPEASRPSGSHRLDRVSKYATARAASGQYKKPKAQTEDENKKWSFFCVRHRGNDTHNTEDCISIKASHAAKAAKTTQNDFLGSQNAPSTSSRKPCVYCGGKWLPGHTCQAYYKSEAYKTKRAQEDKIVLAISKSVEDEEMPMATGEDSEGANESWRRLRDDSANECKNSLRNEKKHLNENHFQLMTPLYIESLKMIGKIDTGSEISCINQEVLSNKLKITDINPVFGQLNFAAFGKMTKRIGETNPLKIAYLNGISFEHSFEVLQFNEAMDFDVLLGADILPKLNIGLTGVAVKWEDDFANLTLENNAKFRNINFDQSEHEPDNSPFGTPEEGKRFLREIKESVQRNQQVPITSFCSVPESVISLPTKEGATAFKRQYNIAHHLKPVLDKQIKAWVDAGTVKKCPRNTSFNSPLLLVPKKNGNGEVVDHRVCLDVRGINRLLPDVSFPVPIIRDVLDSLEGKKIFTTLDLKSAYNRFLVNPDDQHKLTFTHNNQQYCFQGTCFGLKHVTSVFCKVMAIIFQDMGCVSSYVDDCIIASETIEDHIRDVKKVIDRLTSVNLILNPDKCHWFQHSVYMLGFVVSAKGTSVDPRKLTNVEQWPTPENNKDIQKFMGLINYFREYIPMISKVAAPIDRLRNDPDVKTHWTEEHTKSFESIKKILQSKALLHYPDMNKKFYVATDASIYGIAGVLFQRDDQSRIKHISFVSSSLSPSQRNWSTTKRELFAVVFALRKFRKYIWGRKFELYTDHKALVYLHTQKVANPMMIGWIDDLLDFDFDVVHIPGINNILPDTLSRLYPPCDIKLEEDEMNRKHGSRMAWKRKVKGQTSSINIHAVKLSQVNIDTLDYITPPEEERDAILKEAHDFGHFGSESIVKEIHSNGIHWTNLYKDATNVVKSCQECQRHNISKKGYHPLKNVTAFLPFDHVGFDLAGPLPVTTEGQNTYLLVLVDICTRYVILKAIPNKQSDTVAKALIQIFGDYGFPRIMQSDNGREFKNSLMHQISKNLGIDRRFSTPYHSRGNGVSENAVKTALNTIRKMTKKEAYDWDHYLPMVQLAINYKFRSRTNSAPFSLMFARKLNSIKEHGQSEESSLPVDSVSLEELQKRTEYMATIVFPAIQERTRKILEIQSKKFNENNVMVNIDEGTPVMVRLPNRSGKLAPLYEGPFIVVRKTQGGTYVLKDETNELLHREYVPSELKVVSVDETEIEDELYEVEDIRDHRGNPGHREYLVKWAGYGERVNTWEPAESFTDTKPINDYWKKTKELERSKTNRNEVKKRSFKTYEKESDKAPRNGKRAHNITPSVRSKRSRK